jgi:hypothetical protein
MEPMVTCCPYNVFRKVVTIFILVFYALFFINMYSSHASRSADDWDGPCLKKKPLKLVSQACCSCSSSVTLFLV